MKVGILGAGQLGQMLALAGRRLGVECRLLSPDPHAPAGQFAELIVADYANEAALAHFAEGLDVVTYEFESIPVEAVEFVAGKVPVRPPAAALRTAQDRAEEKKAFARIGMPAASYTIVDVSRDLRAAAERSSRLAAMDTMERVRYGSIPSATSSGVGCRSAECLRYWKRSSASIESCR